MPNYTVKEADKGYDGWGGLKNAGNVITSYSDSSYLGTVILLY